MDPAPRPSSSPLLRLDRVLTAILLLGAVIYSIFLYRDGSPYAGGSDSSGYLNSARLLGEGKFFGPVRVPDIQSPLDFHTGTFQPLGFSADPQQPRMAPTYPLGLPLHLLAAAKIGGWDRAALLVNVFVALSSGGLLWLLARHFNFSRAWAAIAVAWLWLCPQFVFCALQPMSDCLALAWSLAVLYAALRSQDSARWSVACGAALAMAVLVRPTNILLFLPVVVAIGFRPLPLLWLILGGIPGAIVLACYNHHVYGAIITTGYSDVAASFGASFVPHNVLHMLRWIPGGLSPLICVAIVLPFLPGPWKRDSLVLALWTALLIGFYLFYYHTGEHWWYLRFILPAYPLLILAAISVMRRIPARPAIVQASIMAAALAFVTVWEVNFNRLLHSTVVRQNEQLYRQSADWARGNLPGNSAIFCMQVSGAFYFYTEFLVVRWDQIEPKHISPLLTKFHSQHRPVYAMLYEFETTEALARIGGPWEQVATVGATTVWQLKN